MARLHFVTIAFLASCTAPSESSFTEDAGVPRIDPDGALGFGDAGLLDATVLEIRDAGHPDSGDESAPFFDSNALRRIELTMSSEDWNALRRQSRTLEDTLTRPECLSTPFVSPFSTFPADVTIDGHRVGRTGVRKKGFLGSMSEEKPSLKIKLDEYDNLEYLDVKSLTLNNGQQDPAILRACIGFSAFRAAGLPAPRCNLALVSVNGESLGVYANVESITKRFLARHFVSREGQLYEGTLSDFRADWLGTFEQKTNEQSSYDRADLDAVRHALLLPDDELIEQLETVVDLDEFLRFWAMEVILDHWDGYAGNTNNFFIYREPGDTRFAFIPWGMDAILGVLAPATPTSVRAEALLARRLYFHPRGRAMYLDTLRRILNESWHPEQLVAEIDHFAEIMLSELPEGRRSEVSAAIQVTRDFVSRRRGVIEQEISSGAAEWTSPLRAPVCFDKGQIQATVSTTFGTHPAPDIFATGSGTFSSTTALRRIDGLLVGTSSGFGDQPDDRDDAVVLLAATTITGEIPILYLAIDPAFFHPGIIHFDQQRIRGALLELPRLGMELRFLGQIIEGTLTISRASTEPGSEVQLGVRAAILAQRAF